MALAEVQRLLRDAVVSGDDGPAASMLVGGTNASKRLAIHQRHYETSLAAVITGRFPATGWLIGGSRLEEAARQFVRRHPPTAPCMAEYGAAFPAFLRAWPSSARLTYVPDFADLDWHLGRLAVCVDAPAVGREHLATMDPTALLEQSVTLQQGTQYVEAEWPVDTLISLYLQDATPASWTLTHEPVHVQVRGSRGSLHFSRLSAGDARFRVALLGGATLGEAAGRALDADATFDPGVGLLALLDEQVVTSIGGSQGGAA